MAQNHNNRNRDPFQNLRDRQQALDRNIQENLGIPSIVAPVPTAPPNLGRYGSIIEPLHNEDLWYQQSTIQDNTWREIQQTIPHVAVDPILHGNLIFNTAQPPNFSSSRRTRLTSAKASRPGARPNPYAELYRIQSRINLAAKKDDLNTRFKSFRLQSVSSIEIPLLNAIAKGERYFTKSTQYNPASGELSLYDEVIAKLDAETFMVVEVRKPSFADAKRTNLYRLRLRQLGIRCVVVKKKDRLYFDKKDYVILRHCQTAEIPAYYRKICLPPNIQKKNLIHESAIQLSFEFDDKGIKSMPLPEYEESDAYAYYGVRMDITDRTDAAYEMGVRLTVESTPNVLYSHITSKRFIHFGRIDTLTWLGPARDLAVKKLVSEIKDRVSVELKELSAIREKEENDKLKQEAKSRYNSLYTNSYITTTTTNSIYWATAATYSAATSTTSGPTISNSNLTQTRIRNTY
jgi:hypothetical protein